ncbi:HAUS augmin-like complex subunit 1 isoform X1 [Synchiropus splendidus]|uniref:HAUS augmin-like complex subunit 1 isoform X1 n=1 Tax=Synchiropus splendidus TaxID=270530 RepID=UPI00237DE26A|nr:HAUS augmin-like complex subunit 1 isoform X1 [Synchiropus splendidus]
MGDKIKKVNVWLSSVLGDRSTAGFEVNTRTVDVLYQLAEASEARCNQSALLIDDLKQKTSEYQAEGAHLQDVLLQGVGLSCGSLSGAASDHVAALVDGAMVLAVRDTSLCSFLPAVNQLSSGLLEAEKSHRTAEREMRALRKRLAAAMVTRSSLQEDVRRTAQNQSVDSAKAEDKLLDMDFVKAKAKELSNRRERAEAKLVSRKMDKWVTHPAVVQLSEEVATLRHDVARLKKQLEPYMDLSPSPSLAQVKIEEAKRALAALDSQLEANVQFK